MKGYDFFGYFLGKNRPLDSIPITRTCILNFFQKTTDSIYFTDKLSITLQSKVSKLHRNFGTFFEELERLQNPHDAGFSIYDSGMTINNDGSFSIYRISKGSTIQIDFTLEDFLEIQEIITENHIAECSKSTFSKVRSILGEPDKQLERIATIGLTYLTGIDYSSLSAVELYKYLVQSVREKINVALKKN